MIYSATIRSATDANDPVINLGQNSSSDLLIFNLEIMHKYDDFSAPGQLVLIGMNRIMPSTGTIPDPDTVIESGDIIEIEESFDGENFLPFFSGYVLYTDYRYTAGLETLTVYVDTRLAHWKQQYMIQTFNELRTLGPGVTGVDNSDFNSNKVKFSDLVNFLIDTSIFEYVRKFRDFKVIYQAPNITNLLGPNNKVWYYASSGSTKEQVLNTTLLAYQVICWQDRAGNIVFTVPSEKDQSTFNIDKRNNPDFRDLTIRNAQANTPNNVVATCMYLGFFPPDQTENDKNVTSQSVPNPKYFPKSAALYKTGYFNQTKLETRSLQTNMLTDPELLNLLSNVNYLVPSNTLKTRTIMGLLSARFLAASLTNSKVVEIQLERNYRTAEIPVGKVIKVDGKPYFCIQCDTSMTASINDIQGTSVSNTMTLTGVPLRSITGYWYNE